MKTRGVRAMKVAVLLILVLLPWRAEATVFFDEGFESAETLGAPSGWALKRSWGLSGAFTPPSGNPSEPSDNCYFTTERAHTGTKSFKADYTNCCTFDDPQGDCYASTAQPNLPGNLTEAWIRYWRFAQNYGMKPGFGANKNVYLWTNGEGYPNFLLQDLGTLTTAMVVQNSRDCGSPTDPFPGGPYTANCNTSWNAAPNLGAFPGVNGVWQCMEAHIKLNTVTGGVPDRNGMIESFIDGTPVMRGRNLAFQPFQGGSGQLVQLFNALILYRQGAAPGSVLYYDDVAVGDQRIGCGGSPTVPSPPRVLQLGYYWLRPILILARARAHALGISGLPMNAVAAPNWAPVNRLLATSTG